MRQKSYDILRVFACLLIVCMHAPVPSEQANGLFLSTLSYFTAPGIGLFFMLSGALLLPLKTDTFTFLKKRISKVVFPTLFWTLFYLGANVILRGETIDITKILSIPFSTQGNPVLWFMYTLIGLYLLSPILSRWLTNSSKKEVVFYLGLWGGKSLLSTIKDVRWPKRRYYGYFILFYRLCWLFRIRILL